jgi:hypothetical protein
VTLPVARDLEGLVVFVPANLTDGHARWLPRRGGGKRAQRAVRPIRRSTPNLRKFYLSFIANSGLSRRSIGAKRESFRLKGV